MESSRELSKNHGGNFTMEQENEQIEQFVYYRTSEHNWQLTFEKHTRDGQHLTRL